MPRTPACPLVYTSQAISCADPSLSGLAPLLSLPSQSQVSRPWCLMLKRRKRKVRRDRRAWVLLRGVQEGQAVCHMSVSFLFKSFEVSVSLWRRNAHVLRAWWVHFISRTSLHMPLNSSHMILGSMFLRKARLTSASTISSSASRGWRGKDAGLVLQVLMAHVRKLRVRSFILCVLLRKSVGFSAFEFRRFVVKCVVLADTFGAGRFATNNFWPRERSRPVVPAL